MSIKIEGDGNKENVFSDSDSGMPLWNGTPFGLLPPDLTKKQEVTIAGPNSNGIPIIFPFTVPEDGWIVGINSNFNVISCTIDGIDSGTPAISSSGYFLTSSGSYLPALYSEHTPYPVKKGQIISIKNNGPIVNITFAPCMSV